MSMVEITQGMPVSGDGLIMEWYEAPYGPLFPGLPGGLSLTLTLDGDTVAGSEVEPGIEGWEPADDWAGAVEGFAGRVARLDPLSPVAYRLLALRAIEDAAGVEADEQTALARAGALERERAASHLGWLASFGYLFGDRWLSRRAAELQLALLRAADAGEVERLEPGVEKFVRRVLRTPLLKSRLEGIGLLGEDATEMSGPVARARGAVKDARVDEAVYRDLLGFQAVVCEGDDALARFQVRLEEVGRSLAFIRDAGPIGGADRHAGVAASWGTGTATVETPRGTATLSVTVEDGEVTVAELNAPSTEHLELVQSVTVGNEVADALVGVASLDLSPWEVPR
jgi:Ni,Fe-hydrogenase III large subunit